MKDFVEDPHTAPIGPFGRFYGRIILNSDVEFASFRRDKAFSSFLRNTGLFIERGDLACTRARPIGFFNKKLPHDTRIPFFDEALHQIINFRKPFQIVSQPLYEGKGSVLKCYVYFMIADPRHEAELIEDMALLNHPNLEFYLWSSFKESKERTKKVGIINAMNTFAIGHSSILIKGIQENCFMRLCSTKHADDDDMDAIEEFVDASMMDQDLFEASEQELNQQLSQVHLVQFLHNHLVDSEGHPIYVKVNGPCNGLTEVVFKNDNWDIARKIEKQFQATLIKFMTPASIRKAFTYGAQLVQRPPDHLYWNPPKLITNTAPANTMNDVPTPPLSKKLRHVNFSYTTKSDYSYRSAALAGTRKVDIPSTVQLTTYAEATAGTTSQTIHHGSIVSTMTEEEIRQKFKSYEDAMTLLKTQVAQLLLVQTETTKAVHANQVDMISKHQENKTAIKKLKRNTEKKIKSTKDELLASIDKRSRKEAINTHKMQLMLQLVCEANHITIPTDDETKFKTCLKKVTMTIMNQTQWRTLKTNMTLLMKTFMMMMMMTYQIMMKMNHT